jgi:hypothetical protein
VLKMVDSTPARPAGAPATFTPRSKAAMSAAGASLIVRPRMVWPRKAA